MNYTRTKIDGTLVYSPVRIEVVDEDGVERAMNELGLAREIKEAMGHMGPGQLATVITSAIPDADYLRNTIQQMQNNLDGRV